MSVVLNPPLMKFEAYLNWEAQQPDRHEFLSGEMFAMTRARATHNTIALNTAVALREALLGTPCRTFIADMKVQAVKADASFYPDVFVSCDLRDRGADAELVQRHPKLVVEVLSDRTATFDRGQKFEAYRTLDSLLAYLLVEQNRVHVDLFSRNSEGQWVLTSYAVGDTVSITSIDISLPTKSIYSDVSFDNARASPTV